MKTKIIVIVGPTAVGKTALAIEVAKRFNGEVLVEIANKSIEDLILGRPRLVQKSRQLFLII